MEIQKSAVRTVSVEEFLASLAASAGYKPGDSVE